MNVFRVYEHVGKDGYPPEWHRLLIDDLGIGVVTERRYGIKDLVREQAGHRCVRCGHPYRNGEHGDGQWSPCDSTCRHPSFDIEVQMFEEEGERFALWRILTVHHLDGDKRNCCWWNLAALCQRCHLTIQGRVQLHRIWPWEHSDWFKPYAAGWYAHAYLAEELTREQAEARLDELLALERVA